MPLFGSPDYGNPNTTSNVHNIRNNTNGMGQFPAGAIPPANGQTPSLWGRMFGSSTPSGLVQQREANGGQVPIQASPPQQPTPAGGQVGGHQATLGTSTPSVTSTPEQAGTINSIQPGFFNGNAGNGVPRSEVGLPDVDMATAMRTLGMSAPPGVRPGAPPPAGNAPPPPPGSPQTATPWIASGARAHGNAGDTQMQAQMQAMQQQRQQMMERFAATQAQPPGPPGTPIPMQQATAANGGNMNPPPNPYASMAPGAQGAQMEAMRAMQEAMRAQQGLASQQGLGRQGTPEQDALRSRFAAQQAMAAAQGQTPVAPPVGDQAGAAPPAPVASAAIGTGAELAAEGETAQTQGGGDPWEGDERPFRERFGQPRPTQWGDWDDARRQQFMENHYQEESLEARNEPRQSVGWTYQGNTQFDQLIQGQYNDQGIMGPGGTPRTWSSLTWQNAQNMGIDPGVYATYSEKAFRGFWDNTNINPPPNGHLPDPGTYTRPPGNGQEFEQFILPWDTTTNAGLDPQDIGQVTSNNAIRWLIEKAVQKASRIAENNGSPAEQARWMQQSEAMNGMLSQYGIHFNPRGSGIDPPEGATVVVPSGGGGPGGTPGTESPHTTPGDHDPGFDDTRNRLNLGDTDLDVVPDHMTAGLDRWLNIFNDMPNGMSAEQRAAAMEFMRQDEIYRNGLANQQRGVNILQQGYEQGQDDPIRQRSMEDALGFFDDPTGVDWQGIQNRAISDSDINLDQMRQGLGAGAARRGLSPGTTTGMYNELALGQGNSLARQLGMLDTQEQMATREGQYRAAQHGANLNQNYRGADDVRLQMLANAVMGAPNQAQNPYSGMADTAMGMSMMDLMQQQQDFAENDNSALYAAGIGALGNILGSAAGGGMFGGMG